MLEIAFEGKDIGLPISNDAVLPFLLSARAQGELASHSGARAFFAEGLSSSYEAFHHTRDARGKARDIGDDGLPVPSNDTSSDDSIAETTSWYERQVAALIPSKTAERRARLLHPKVSATVKHSRFTLMFEAFAIRVLQACSSLKQAATLLRLDWDTVQGIMKRAVERGLERRETEQITQIGIDEKSFLRGHNYASVMTDISGSRVLEVVDGRTEEATDSLWKTLSEEQRAKVQAVSMDMWLAFIASTGKNAPSASIVFDRFHVSKDLNEAVDQVRRQENNSLKKDEDATLVGTKQMWLFNPENLSFNRLLRFSELKEQSLRTGRAWAMKEQFRTFWECFSRVTALGFFEQWYEWASKSKLTPMVARAAMLKRHLPGLLNYFKHRMTNAMSEGFNSKIQQIKSNARGFRSFQSYRARILFFCGKLDLLPRKVSH